MNLTKDAVEFRIEGSPVRAERTDTRGVVLLTFRGDVRERHDIGDSMSDATSKLAVHVIEKVSGKRVGKVASNSDVCDLADLLASVVDQR